MAGAIRRIYRLRKDTKKKEEEAKRIEASIKRKPEAKKDVNDVNVPASRYGGSRLGKEIAAQDEATRKEIERLLRRKKK